jgi:hypothetical protein
VEFIERASAVVGDEVVEGALHAVGGMVGRGEMVFDEGEEFGRVFSARELGGESGSARRVDRSERKLPVGEGRVA